MRPGWIRSARCEWQHYIGRRVRRLREQEHTHDGRRDGPRVYVAWAGNRSAGRHGSLEAAQEAAERA